MIHLLYQSKLKIKLIIHHTPNQIAILLTNSSLRISQAKVKHQKKAFIIGAKLKTGDTSIS